MRTWPTTSAGRSPPRLPRYGKAIIYEQIEIIRTQWDEAADAARLTELDRRQLYGREILNEFVFRS